MMSHDTEEQFEQQARRHELFAMAMFRIFKLATMHDLNNQAVQRGIEHSHNTLREIFIFEDQPLTILFVHDDIYINGQALKASRATYEALQELGTLLDQISYNQLRIERHIDPESLREMLSTFEALKKHPSPTPVILLINAQVSLQRVDLSALIFDDHQDDGNIPRQIARAIATTQVLLDYTLRAAQQNAFPHTTLLKRAVQQLVMLSEHHGAMMISALDERPERHNTAHICVQTTILVVLMARALTQEPGVLMDLAMCTINHSVAEAHFRKTIAENDPFAEADDQTPLTPEQRDELRDRAPLVTTLMTGFYDRSLRRATLSYEVHSLLNRERTGQPYQGKAPPSIEAIIIATAYRFQQVLCVDDFQGHTTPDEALAHLIMLAQSPAERLALKLMCATLGLFPRGSFITLSGGLDAIVSANHEHPDLYDKPQIYLLHPDTKEPTFIDLATLSKESLRVGHIQGIARHKAPELVAMQRALMSGQVTAPPLQPPSHGIAEHSSLQAYDPESAPPTSAPPIAMDARRQRLATIQVTADEASRISSLDLEPDPDFFNSRDDLS